MAKKRTAIGDLIEETMPSPTGENEGFTGLMTDIAALAQSAGLTGESDLCNLYAFLHNQAIRYIKGFDAARRFHG